MKITYSHRGPKEFAGRLGGGWQWKVGLQASGRFKTIIISLLVFAIRIEV